MQERFSSVKIELHLQRKRKEVDTLTEEKKLKKDSCDSKELVIDQQVLTSE